MCSILKGATASQVMGAPPLTICGMMFLSQLGILNRNPLLGN